MVIWNFSDHDHDDAQKCCIAFTFPGVSVIELSLTELKANPIVYPGFFRKEVQDLIFAAGYDIRAKKRWYLFPRELCNFSGGNFRRWWRRHVPSYGTVITVTRVSAEEYLARNPGDKAPFYIEA